MRIVAILAAIAVVALGIAASSLFFDASKKLDEAGTDLTFLRSVGGQTVAEAYYQEVGRYGIGFSKLLSGLGYLSLMLSVALGAIILLLRPRASSAVPRSAVPRKEDLLQQPIEERRV